MPLSRAFLGTGNLEHGTVRPGLDVPAYGWDEDITKRWLPNPQWFQIQNDPPDIREEIKFKLHSLRVKAGLCRSPKKRKNYLARAKRAYVKLVAHTLANV